MALTERLSFQVRAMLRISVLVRFGISGYLFIDMQACVHNVKPRHEGR